MSLDNPTAERVYEYIRHTIKVEQRPPTIREVAKSCKIAASTAQSYLNILEAHGLIKRVPGARGIRLVEDEDEDASDK